MQCPLLPSPLSCSVRRESCSQTDEALRSSSCYKYSVVSLELVSLREKKKKRQGISQGSLQLPKQIHLSAQLFCSDWDGALPWDTGCPENLGPPESPILSFRPMGHRFTEPQILL